LGVLYEGTKRYLNELMNYVLSSGESGEKRDFFVFEEKYF